MLTLCIDTAYKYLTCVLIKDEEIIASYSEQCFKKQSEEVFVALQKIFEQANIERNAIDSLCISEGPGSYTGVRIAMTIGKVIAQVLPCKLYTISTLRLYASNQSNTMVLMDARANRAYVGIYDKDKIIMDDCAMDLKEIDPKDYNIVGDGSLIGKEDFYPDLGQAFLKSKAYWHIEENIAYVKPKYLKESESYYR